MTKIADVIRAAIPDADQDLCDHILWGRTAYPFEKLSAQKLYKAADRFRRANANGLRLCEFCDGLAMDGKWACEPCDLALKPIT